ncbi:hypothetical protein [Clostridium botulinum]|uniref:hypothetical protein n=1 Tax=Clostridium botulinum TaxID=1491 RepID=UPI001E53038B|nr:hypothetical protein [Clostridium botulinum]MCD3223782.1 hypothetical protein [Clostridium botulinum C/D]MCD3297158.1 hypothetical protein [Clostridium botulinum C/D]
MGNLKRFYKCGSPSIPGGLIKNLMYKILWRLNRIESPSMGRYKTYIKYRNGGFYEGKI